MILLKMMFGSEKDERVALEEHRYLVKLLLQNCMNEENVSLILPYFTVASSCVMNPLIM